MNIAELVRLQARARPEKAAIEFGAGSLSYADAWAAIAALADRLIAAGVQSGERVALCLRDHPTHVLAHYAVAAIGAVILPIDHRASAAEKAAIAGAFEPRLALIDDDGDEIEGVRSERVAQTTAPDPQRDARTLPDRGAKPLLISMSSGTTGRPKGAIVTHRQMYERFVTQWVTLGFNTTDRFVVVTPLYFGAGRSFSMSFLAAGATLIIDPPPHKGERLKSAINRSAATATFLVPTAMRRLLDIHDDELLFPRLRRLLISGEAFFRKRGRGFQIPPDAEPDRLLRVERRWRRVGAAAG